MWTMLFGPLCAVLLSLRHGPIVLVAYALYIVATRLIAALILISYSQRVDLNYVWCLYANQLLNAGVKIYMIWRLPAQRWANRGNQVQGAGGSRAFALLRTGIAGYLTMLSMAGLFLAASCATGLVQHPPAWLLAYLASR
jgi:mannuronan synthase